MTSFGMLLLLSLTVVIRFRLDFKAIINGNPITTDQSYAPDVITYIRHFFPSSLMPLPLINAMDMLFSIPKIF
ncbi:hypothetical protein MetMK1DRAFT_00007930 [Metallosphaera yellowstonensis MK1]|jgi:hypothetical protein|uniref:Uncharacterized protein n=1 Tax=Metallosphaera yellowstonensis MK1 TaxID=671065 RepID=H2C220_9CREN|nr:hypothetical protein MetMK1DRAFT_00007930 [Metallosphaera yellowstonensis MK1]